MNIYPRKFWAFVCTAAFICLSLQLHAEGLQEIKERMKERVQVIDDLKRNGQVGVSNHAYLVARTELSPPLVKLLKAENKDRSIVYAYLADKLNVSRKKVERQRAYEISKKSRKGVWLQDKKGNWYKK